MLDKIRLKQADRLPPELYCHYGFPLGLDGLLTGFLGVGFADIEHRVGQGGTDAEIAEWILGRGIQPGRDQAAVWNEFSRQLGWRDHGNDFP